MANNPNVNKVIYGNQTVMDISDTTAEPQNVLSGEVFYDRSGARQTGTAIGGVPEEELRDTVGWTGKNLLKNVLQNQTASDVTIVVGDDGVITLNGTASADSYKDMNYVIVPNGDYTISSSADSSMAGMYVNAEKLDGTYQNNIANLNNSTFAANSSLYKGYKIGIRIISGKAYSNFKIYPMLRKSSIADSTFEPYHPSVKQTLRDAEVIEGKNIFPLYLSDLKAINTAETWNGNAYTRRGVTFTVTTDEKGIVTKIVANGTASGGDAGLAIDVDIDYLTVGQKYILSGCPAGGGDSKYNLRISKKSSASDTWGTVVVRDNGSGVEITTPSNDYGFCSWIVVLSGQAVSNIAFYPMIRYDSETDPTFEPYYTPLKNSKFSRSEQRVLGAKNRLFIPASVVTKTDDKGITYTVNRNANGDITSIVANGTVSGGTSTLAIASNVSTNGQDLIMSGCPANGSSSSYSLKWRMSGGDIYDYGDGVLIPANSNDAIAVEIRLNNGYTANNVTFYPMIRLASDPDNTYAPYAMTNKELTDKANSLATVATTGSYYDLVDEPQNESATSGQGAYTVSLCTRMEKYQWNQAFNNTVKRHTGSALAGATSVYIPIDFITDHIVSIGADDGHDSILKYTSLSISGGGGLPPQLGITFPALKYDTDFEVLTI